MGDYWYRDMDDFDPIKDLAALEGLVSELASLTDRPQGYPFSEVIIYAVPYDQLRVWCDSLDIHNATVKSTDNLTSMRKFNFKVAGKLLNEKVKEAKVDFDKGIDVLTKYNLPSECITVAERFEVVNEPLRKTTGCRKYLVECKTEDCPDHWRTILFRKEVKRYVTEIMKVNIVPCVFGDKYPERNEPTCPRVTVELVDCSETLYQALEEYGRGEFAPHPIRLKLPTRSQICHAKPRTDYVTLDIPDNGKVKLVITAMPYPVTNPAGSDMSNKDSVHLQDAPSVVKKKSRKQPKYYQVGVTENNEYTVYASVFTLVGTHGVPLEVILDYFNQNNMVVDWLDYVQAALKDGANIGTVKSRIQSAVGECYGPKYSKEVMTRLNQFYPEN